MGCEKQNTNVLYSGFLAKCGFNLKKKCIVKYKSIQERKKETKL